jgi:hypothetical protein
MAADEKMDEIGATSGESVPGDKSQSATSSSEIGSNDLTPREREALHSVLAQLPHLDADEIRRVLTEAHLLGSVYLTRWIECRCGKVRHRSVRESTQRLAEGMLGLYQMGLCRACEADLGRKMDSCPESTDHGACNLSWGHTGRCEPHPRTPEFVHRIASANPGRSVPVLAENPQCVCSHRYSSHATEGLACAEGACGCSAFAVVPSGGPDVEADRG